MRMQWEGFEAKPTIKGGCALILRVDRDREHCERLSCTENAPGCVHRQDLPEALAAHALIPRQASDQRRRVAMFIARQLAPNLFGQFAKLEFECAEAVEANDAKV